MNAPRSDVSVVDVDVCIVGSGFSGLGMAIKLLERKQKKYSFVVLEKAKSLGGTWRDNDYPGCACDVPSDLYSFSFAQKSDWSRKYAPQKEILSYLESLARERGVLEHLRTEREVVSCVFDDADCRWRVTAKTPTGTEVTRARHLVFGIGALHRPKFPKLPGREAFTGVAFHSAQWRHDVDLTGKRVVVIGTGASAIQFVPQIVKQAAHVTVCQRTPPWIMPKADRRIGDVEKWLRSVPGVQLAARASTYVGHESRALGFTVHPKLMNVLAAIGRWHLKKQVKDEALRARLTPNYLPGCKRILISNNWYPALQKPNVVVEHRALTRITADGVEVANEGGAGEVVEADVIIYGTGFNVTEPMGNLEVRGRGGVSIHDVWKTGIAAYRGTHVAGFPNLSILMGPNTGLGHSSMVYMIESQIQLVLDELVQLEQKQHDVVEVTHQAYAEWNASLQPQLQQTVWASGCASWYLDENGKNGTAWPGFTFTFRRLTKKANPQHLTTAPAPTSAKVTV